MKSARKRGGRGREKKSDTPHEGSELQKVAQFSVA